MCARIAHVHYGRAGCAGRQGQRRLLRGDQVALAGGFHPPSLLTALCPCPHADTRARLNHAGAHSLPLSPPYQPEWLWQDLAGLHPPRPPPLPFPLPVSVWSSLLRACAPGGGGGWVGGGLIHSRYQLLYLVPLLNYAPPLSPSVYPHFTYPRTRLAPCRRSESSGWRRDRFVPPSPPSRPPPPPVPPSPPPPRGRQIGCLTLGSALTYVEEGYADIVQTEWRLLTVRAQLHLAQPRILCGVHSAFVGHTFSYRVRSGYFTTCNLYVTV